MRIVEIVLILANVLSLTLNFKKQSKQVWLGAAGVNLAVLLIHGIIEGLRYQMFFSYCFVVLLAGFILIKTRARFFEAKTPRVLKVIAMGLSFVLIGVTAFLAYALPVFAIPKPTGNYDVGVQYVHLIDNKRTEPFLDKTTKKRELMVKIYYPAQKDDSKPYAAYFGDSRELLRGLAAFYHMPVFVFDHLHLVKMHSKKDLLPSDKQQSYPVVLFSHGAGTTMEVQASQSEDLASHGYVVVSIDHTYVSAATLFSDRIVSSMEATTDFNTPEPAEPITQIMVDDSGFVLDKLLEMNTGQMDSIVKGKLNLGKIGAIGHSVGGAVAYNLAINDSRVKAAIDLDGTVFVKPKADSHSMAPFLMLANDRYHVQALQSGNSLMRKPEDFSAEDQKMLFSADGSKAAYNEAYDRAQQNIKGLAEVLKSSGNLFTIEGSDHMKFADIGLFIGSGKLRELIGIGGKTEPQRCLEITKAVTAAFFDQHLKDLTGNSLDTLVDKYPELKRVELN